MKGGTASDVTSKLGRANAGEHSASAKLLKRVKPYTTPPVPIDQRSCSSNHEFMYSWCHRGESPQAWTLACKPSPNLPFNETQIISYGECRGHMLCIDGAEFQDRLGKGYNKATASCFEPEYFVELSKNMAEIAISGSTGDSPGGGQSASGDSSPPIHKPDTNTTTLTGVGPPRGAHVSLEALLTTENRRKVLKAAHMEMFAESMHKIGNYEAWGSVLNGHKSCDECSTLAIWDVPPYTQRAKMNVELPSQASSGLLFFYNGPSS